MTKLNDVLKNVKKPKGHKSGPIWEGPSGEGPNGGISFSLLCRFISCPERFRLQVMGGLKVKDKFEPRMEYGNMWHLCEECVAARKPYMDSLTDYCKSLITKYPYQQLEIEHWYMKCLAQFPIYVDWWKKHPDQLNRKPLLQEEVFDVRYTLPSGKSVRLRGKWDSVDLVDGERAGVWIQENKTKSAIDSQKIARQLTFDLQTMMYVVALTNSMVLNELCRANDWEYLPAVKGVRYNVIRRSAHKTPDSMLKKIHEDIADGRGGEWFARWNIDITNQDIARFRLQCLNPILERLCEWWECMKFAGKDPFNESYNCKDNYGIHYRHPFGIYNPMDEGGSSDLDAYLADGSEIGLQRTEDLFPELRE